MKTLKDMFVVYRPKSPDEQKFVDKHVTVKHKDRNEVNGKANGDDVFKGSNIKTVQREKTRHGYDLGADEKVYEENEFVNEEEELVDEGILDFMKKKKPKVTVGKMTPIKDLPDGEKPFQKMAAIRDKKQMTKEAIINRTIEKYMPEVADIKALTMEERLAKKLDGLSEGHTALLFSLFTNLNEDNQMKMIEACSDRDGINELIDFALENRGE